MASIFDRYGVKEVVDGTFYALADDARLNVKKGQPVLFIDSLKVSTTEVTADQSEAKGGRGNTSLIIWDFGKEITVNLQDALISPLSLALITGGTAVEADANTTISILQREVLEMSSANTVKVTANVTLDGSVTPYAIHGGKRYDGTVNTSSAILTFNGATFAANDTVEVFYGISIGGSGNFTGNATEITINAANFPGTYKFVGDTVIRNQSTGADEPFQMVIEKCKMSSDFTITMEAEGDPSAFDMNLRVLRDDNKNMIRFIKYNLS